MSTFAFTDEQLQLRESVRRYLTDHATVSRTRELMGDSDGFDRQSFQGLFNELGIGGVHLPEEYGGAGLSYVELCVVLEEMGRALYPSPYLSSNVLAANALLLTGTTEQKAELLPLIASGARLATVALYEDSNRSDVANIEQIVVGGSFTGTKSFVLDATVAECFVVVAREGSDRHNAPRFWLADSNDPGIKCSATESIDSTRRIGSVSFDNVSVERLGEAERDLTRFDKFVDLASVALANEMVGGAQWLLESSVEYANSRVQFGRPISSMQAIKHKCADLLLEIELAKSGAYRAAQAVADDDPALPVYANIAKAAANDAYMKSAADAIQIHGGIGFTWDNDTHLWFKRAKSSQVLLGTSEIHRDQLLERIDFLEAD
ncbi:MAG: acyl-CoA/acyl-ACP dehydrogenase [Gammaproteobacteria bacterium]|nr:acyl-CoA/acyl-ACP dehydrogenase [Gammaproteobacteria bacterium]